MLVDKSLVRGKYELVYLDKLGAVKWKRNIDNVVCTLGKNFALNTFLAGVGYTVTGPYMGLITGTGFTGVSVDDTMAVHPGWLEAGSVGARQVCSWSPAVVGSISLAPVPLFTITGSDAIQGAFIGYGPGMLNTVFDINGVLWSAGVFLGGAQPVSPGGQLYVAYTANM